MRLLDAAEAVDARFGALCTFLLYTGCRLSEARESLQGDVRVSTVFLGLDHRFGDGPPLLFETMAFVGHDDVGMERYSTWQEAEEGHARWVAKIFKATPTLALPGA